jgi:hypothetical protein
MRLWSIHPKYLDSKGLVAVWREGLLAQKVLAGKTKGYRNHPQLERFKKQKNPIASIGYYLYWIYRESSFRYYNFDRDKILILKRVPEIKVTSGQIKFEIELLKKKTKTRNLECYERLACSKNIDSHPLFKIVPGGIEKWERTNK